MTALGIVLGAIGTALVCYGITLFDVDEVDREG